MKFRASSTKAALVKLYKAVGDDVRILSSTRKLDSEGNAFYEITARRNNPVVSGNTRNLFVVATILFVVVISLLYIFTRSGETGAISSHDEKPGMEIEASSVIPSIAVIPLVNLSEGGNEEYFGDGLAEDLISSFARLKNIKVVNRTSSFTYKNTNLDIQTIGRELSVNSIIEGSFRINEEKLRIVVNLIDVSDGFTIWTQTFNREKKDLFDIQEEIAFAIVKALEVELGLDDSGTLRTRSTKSLDAFNEYNRAMYFLDRRSEEGFTKAIEYFRNTIDLDADFAKAHLGLGVSHYLLGSYGYRHYSEAFSRARPEIEKAINLDPSLGEAYAMRARIRRDNDLDWEGAEEDFLRAIDLNPNSANAHHWYALYLGDLGRFDEAMEHLLIARESQPVSRQINLDIAVSFLDQGDVESCLDQLYKTIEMFPNFKGAHNFLLFTLLRIGKIEESIAEFERYNAISGQAGLTAQYKSIIEEQGIISAVRIYVNAAKEHLFPWELAALCTFLGEREKALDYLEQAFTERSGRIFHLKYETAFRSLHDEPRFIALLEKLGLD